MGGKYIYNKNNLVRSLKNLTEFVENNFIEDGRRDNPIRALFDHLDTALFETENEYPDLFGTESYEHSIFEKD